ncbi:MAG TPA: hypothetical protein VFE46_09225 [Pirellulales bacterium]|jgi:hypothetical protein|nr:hypothetical protein [Pirellulales bacterium]
MLNRVISSVSVATFLWALAGALQAFASDPPKGYRKLGPGVETTIAAQPNPQDTVTTHDIVEIQSAGQQLDWKPETQSASTTLQALTKDIPFRHGVWYLEFSFKPLRIINVDMPLADGHMDRRMVWYMVYRVKNLGQHLEAEAKEGKNQSLAANQPSTQPVYFHPQFVLESPQFKKAYLDRVLPLAEEAIEQRDDSHRKLLDTVQMGKQPIPLSTADDDHSVWGVATWEYVDPRIDFFNIYVQGLSNAYRFEDQQGAYKLGDPPGTGRHYYQKTLKLNFWRPGDEHEPDKEDIYFGTPGQVDHEWVFR